MPTPFETQAVLLQFHHALQSLSQAQSDILMLRGMIHDLLGVTVTTHPPQPMGVRIAPIPNSPLPFDEKYDPRSQPTSFHVTDQNTPAGQQPVTSALNSHPPTEAPAPRAPQHFDGHHWRKGPSPEPSDADKPVGQG